MAIRQIKICPGCAETMAEHYELTELQNPELKRGRCAHCSFRGYISDYSYNSSRPLRKGSEK